MSKYSQEFKLEAVNYYLSGHAGQRATAKRFGVGYGMVRKWVDVYNHFGAQALKPKEKHNQYSAQFKYKVVQAVHQQGLSQRPSGYQVWGFGAINHTQLVAPSCSRRYKIFASESSQTFTPDEENF